MSKEIYKGLKAHEALQIITADKFKADFISIYALLTDMHGFDDAFRNNVDHLGTVGVKYCKSRLEWMLNPETNINAKIDRVKYAADLNDLHTFSRYLADFLIITRATNLDIAAIAFYCAMGKAIQRYKYADDIKTALVLFNNGDCNLIMQVYNDFKQLDKKYADVNSTKEPHEMTLTWNNGNMNIDLVQFLPATAARMNILIKLIEDKAEHPFLTCMHLQAVICDMIQSRAYTTQQKKQLQANLNALDRKMYFDTAAMPETKWTRLNDYIA